MGVLMEGLRERKKRQTRDAIAAAAMELFQARGFEEVTVADVARAADVSEKTVFNHFPTKEDLVFARGDELRDALLAPGEGEVLLGREVVEHRLLRDVGGSGDLGDGDRVEPALGEQPTGGGRDGLAGGALLACAKALCLCA